jgi:hypothetical protein
MRSSRTILALLTMALFLACTSRPSIRVVANNASQEVIVYTCPMHREVQSSEAGSRCPKCEMKLVPEKDLNKEQKAATASTGATALPEGDAYTCTMHPQIRSGAPGRCPLCDMALTAVVPAIGEEFELRVEATPPAPKPNEKVRLRFSIFNPKTGAQARDFQIMHDQLFHLFIVSQDLSEFQHIHPDFNKDGSFTIETVLPRPGRYKLYADFYPSEGVPQVLQASIATAGTTSDLFAGKARIEADTAFVKTIDGLKIELKMEPPEAIGGQDLHLTYTLTDATTGQPVQDLKPYLAAWGHTLILSDDQINYVHSHPDKDVPNVPDKEKLRGGPEVTFDAIIPQPGHYRVWTQFLRGDKLTTVSFTIKAKRLG